MKWHFRFKTFFRKLAMFFSSIMGAALLSKANLTEVKTVGSREEMNYFVSTYFLGEIKLPYNILFGVLILVGMALLLVSWKGFENRHRDAVLLTNIGLGHMATTSLAYGVTTLCFLKVFSWEVPFAFFVSAFIFCLLIKNVIHYKNRKELLEDVFKSKKVVVSSVVAAVLSIVMISVFSVISKDIWDDKYEEYREKYSRNNFDLLTIEPEYESYIRLQFVNMFNLDGESFTYDEFKESVENFNNDKGSWYALWYCHEFIEAHEADEWCDLNFNSYGYSTKTYMRFVNYACDKLKYDGITPSDAAYEQLDQACQYVYDTYINQVPLEVIGDQEGEVVLHIALPEDGNVENVQLSHDEEKYRAYIYNWYQVGAVGEDYASDAEPAAYLEDGNIYVARIHIPLVIPCVTVKDAKVQLKGIVYEDIEVYSYRDYISISVWIIPEKQN